MAERVEIDVIARTEKAVAGLGKLVKSLAATYISYKALKDFLASSIKEALGAEQAFISLGSSLRASGQNAEKYTKQLSGLARALSMTSTYAEEETMAAMQSLTQIGRVSAEGMKKVIPVVQDMASALGMDLNSAALLVGKAIEGNVGALSRYGIKVKETADPAERFSNIIKALSERFGGMSEAMAKSAGGGLKQIKNEFDELKEAVGTRLIQAFAGTITWLSSRMKANVILAMGTGDIGSIEEAKAYLSTLQREYDVQKKWMTDNKIQYNPKTKYQQGGAIESTVQRMAELQNKMEGIKRLMVTLGQTQEEFVGPLLSGLSGNVAALEDMSDVYAEINGRIALSTQYQDRVNEQFETGANSVYREVDALIEYESALENVYGKLASKGFEEDTFLNINWEKMRAANMGILEDAKDIKGEWTDIGNQVADWAGAIGAAMATGNFEGLFQKILSMTSTLAIQAAASAAVAQNWPMVAFWLGVAGVASFAGGFAGATHSDTNKVSGMAEGGIVTSPRLALIGERGPEAVVPLGKGMGGNTIIVQGSVWAARDLAREIAGAQARW